MKVAKFMTADPIVLDTENSLWDTACLFMQNR